MPLNRLFESNKILLYIINIYCIGQPISHYTRCQILTCGRSTIHFGARTNPLSSSRLVFYHQHVRMLTLFRLMMLVYDTVLFSLVVPCQFIVLVVHKQHYFFKTQNATLSSFTKDMASQLIFGTREGIIIVNI